MVLEAYTIKKSNQLDGVTLACFTWDEISRIVVGIGYVIIWGVLSSNLFLFLFL